MCITSKKSLPQTDLLSDGKIKFPSPAQKRQIEGATSRKYLSQRAEKNGTLFSCILEGISV